MAKIRIGNYKNTVTQENEEEKRQVALQNEVQSQNGAGSETEDIVLAEKTTKTKEPKIQFEDISKREENVKHFRMDDGTYQAVIYPEPVHYYDEEEGKFLSIDNSFELKGKEGDDGDFTGYVNKRSNVKVKLAQNLNEKNIMTIKKGNHEIVWRLLGKQEKDKSFKVKKDTLAVLRGDEKQKEFEADTKSLKNDDIKVVKNLSNEVRYNDFVDGADLQYVVSSSQIKDNIIIKEKSDSYEYAFELKLKNLNIGLSKDKKKLELFIDKIDDNTGDIGKEVIFSIPEPYMYDAKKVTSADVTYELEESQNGYVFKKIADKEWINSEEREYPVTIDPIIVIQGVHHGTAFVAERYLSTPGANNYVGYETNWGSLIGYIKINDLDFLNDNIIQSATYRIYQSYCRGDLISQKGIEIRQVTDNFDVNINFFYEELDWNTLNSLESIVKNIYYPKSSNGFINLDITGIVNNWKNGDINSGIILKAADNFTTDNYIIFASDHGFNSSEIRPVLIINYVSEKSVKGHFYDFSAKRAGKSSVDLYTGKLIHTHVDLVAHGSNLPMQIAHIFNSNYCGAHFDSEMPVGKGWKLNIQQKIITMPLINQTDVVEDTDTKIYIDSQGFEHEIIKRYYFDKYVTYDGSKTKIIKQYIKQSLYDENNPLHHCEYSTSTGLIYNSQENSLTDKNGNKLYFNSRGDLIEIASCYDNSDTRDYLYITYGSDNKIYVVKDPAGRFAFFSYDSNCRLGRIQCEDYEIYYSYDSNGYLKYIRYTSDTSQNYSEFEYDSSGKLKTAIDQSGFKLSYNYNGNKVRSISESANTKIYYSSNPEGGKATDTLIYGDQIEINYLSKNFTKIKRNSDIEIGYIFNDTGALVTTYEDTKTGISKYQQVVSNNAIYNRTRKLLEIDGIIVNNSNVYEIISATLNPDAKNLLLNPGLNPNPLSGFPNQWTIENLVNGVDCYNQSDYVDGSNSFEIKGELGVTKRIRQRIFKASLQDNKMYMLSGWAMADSLPLPEEWERDNSLTRFELSVEMVYNGRNDIIKHVSFDPNNKDWQFAALPFRINYFNDLDYIEVYVEYSHNTNYAHFDNIRLCEAKGSITISYENDYMDIIEDINRIKYELDGDGNVFRNTINNVFATNYNYSGNNLMSSTDYRGKTTSYLYDDVGNVTNTTISGEGFSITSWNSYEGRLLDCSADDRGKVTDYQHDARGYVSRITMPNGQHIDYYYDNYYDLLQLLSTTVTDYNGSNEQNNNNFSYNKGYLTRLNHNNFDYKFEYDGLGRIKNIYVGESLLLSNKYDKVENIDGVTGSRIRAIKSYANGNTFAYYYDKYDRLIKTRYIANGSTSSNFNSSSLDYNIDEYYSSGNLKKHFDKVNNIEYNYNYSDAGELVGFTQEYKGTPSENTMQLEIQYDDYKRLNTKAYAIHNRPLKTYTYEYDENANNIPYPDNRLKKVNLPDSITSEMSYDGLGRLYYKKNNNNSISYTDHYIYGYGTTLVSGIEYWQNGTRMATLWYTYEDNGNIIEIRDKDNLLISSYEYDGINRLIRENIAGVKSVLYDYGSGGNIMSRKEYSYTLTKTSTLKNQTPNKTYNYSCSPTITGWRDQLYIFNGCWLAQSEDPYDANGNPKYWFKTANEYTTVGYVLSWTHGRRLSQVTEGANIYSYTYDNNGIRIGKTANGITYRYYVEGSRIIAEDRTEAGVTKKLFYYYDANGICGFSYHDGTTENRYIYRRNLQGDITDIIDSGGNIVASYKYDAWGNVISKTGTLADINPFRYRGYCQDNETNWYYLSSRYYDSFVGRFINADDVGILSETAGEINGLNLYAYCYNNPVMYTDSTGCSPFWDGVKKALGWVALAGLAVFTVAEVIASGGTLPIPVLAGFAIGASISLVGQGVGNLASGKGFFEGISWQSVVMGGLAGAAFATGIGGFWGAVAIGAVSNAGTSALENKSWANIGLSFVVGGVAAGVGYGAGRLVGRAVFGKSDLVFKDIFNLAIQDTGKIMASMIAMRATYYTFAPMLTTGMTRGLSKFLGNKGISWL